ncbi:hypothetical protein [Anaerobaca lacustris]|uniref:Uncharacterized protein n=1 Tax=Anaerobaca lacustris TaxID=3044600 RepID=A0AAW6TWX0_9BACT|nr:hypothetical protein [Sedimentisphaerales bacterium M17dextr]
MAKTNSKNRTRSDKFPLTLHRTGQYCKKIRGSFYYFGKEKDQALQRYLEQASYLHTGKGKKPEVVAPCHFMSPPATLLSVDISPNTQSLASMLTI